MTTLVAIPYWHAADYIDRAVRSVLAQTDPDVVVLVCGDGEAPPVTILNDRLVVHSFAAWHGAPFVQQAMLVGSPFETYAPFGADDWADPDHIETARSIGPNVAAGAMWWHNGDTPTPDRIWDFNGQKLYEVGCFRAADMRSIGGYGAHERCSQDVLMLNVMVRSIGVRHTTRPTYHRIKRPGALTTAPETAIRSPLRHAIRRRNRAVLSHCQARGWIGPDAVDAPLPPETLAHIRRYRQRLVPDELRSQLADCAGEIARVLA